MATTIDRTERDRCIECAHELVALDDSRKIAEVFDRWPMPAKTREGRATPAETHHEDRVTPIGPWQPIVHGDGVWYERNERATDLDMWADVAFLGPKRYPHRIVMFGESVLRGYGLDPLFNCADALRALLRADGLGQAADVVDLARNGIVSSLMLDTMRAAAPLGGDIYVVFAGNSWILTDGGGWDGESMVRGLRNEPSWAPVAASVRRMVGANAERIVATILALARQQGAHVVFIIPPYNLRDWRPDPSAVHPLLDRAAQELRSALLTRAQQLLAAGCLAEAEAGAAQAVDLEEGLGPVSLHMLGTCMAAKGDAAQAYTLFERARDALLVLPGPPVPTCPTVVADAIRGAAAAGATVIDVAARLRQINGGAAPGREYFLDGVHLSAAGIQEAMSLLSEQLKPRLASADQPTGDRGPLPPPSAEAMAQGYFSGALFSGFFRQSREEIKTYCRGAATAHPEMIEVMRFYVDRALRRAPDVLCTAYQELRYLEGTFPRLRYLRRRWSEEVAQPKRIYADLIEAMCDTIGERDSDAAETLRALALSEQALSRGPVDLLDPSACERALGAVGFSHGLRHAYFVAYSRSSHFRLMFDGGCTAFRASITTRIVDRQASGKPITLLVNGVRVHAWPATSAWSTTVCSLAADVLTRGANELTIEWPGDGATRLEHASRAADVLACGFVPDSAGGLSVDLYPAFGELHTFTAVADSPVGGRA